LAGMRFNTKIREFIFTRPLRKIQACELLFFCGTSEGAAL